ncbi:MAG: hypothetical protein WCC53_17575 [Thermoanaerobaculia bacterium]
MAIDPSTPTTLYAGTAGGVFKSTDSGGTWAASSKRLPILVDSQRPRRLDEIESVSVTALAIDPATPATLFAGTDGGGVFKSTDSGGIWAAANSGLTNLDVTALAINPSTPMTVFAGTSGGGVFKSNDSGGTWTAINSGLTNLTVRALAIHPSAPATLYAGTSGGVFKSANSGGTWAAINVGLTTLTVTALAINPSKPATLYAGTFGSSGGVFKSIDSGGTWTPPGEGLTYTLVAALAINPSAPTTVFAGTSGGGVFKSTDSGAIWAALNAGLTNLNVAALATSPSTVTTPARLYAGTNFGGGVFSSATSGGIWTAANAKLASLTVGALAVDPSAPGTLYAGTLGASSAVFKSLDSGGTWAAASTGLQSQNVFSLAIDPAHPTTLYAGTYGGGVFRSTDSGGTWAATNAGLTNLNVTALAIHPTTPTTLYAGAAGGVVGVFKSIDSGGTWTAVDAGLSYANVYAVAIDPANGGTTYVGTAGGMGGVFKSTDSGRTWTSAGLANQHVIALAIDRATPARLYAGTLDGGVFRSPDSGQTWVAASTGLSSPAIRALAVSPTAPATLYAGTLDGGVFESADSGGTWTAIRAGLPDLPVLALDATRAATVFAGLTGGSVWQWTSAAGPASVSCFVPIVLDVVGLAHYTSELQLTNLGATSASVRLTYTSSIGSGAGDVVETVPAGQQAVYPDAISHLRTRGVPIPTSGNQGGTLLLSAPSAGVRATVRTSADTVAPQPVGRAGLAYADSDPASSSSTARLYVYGLRTNDADRSNLAVCNMGGDPVSLKVTVVSGDEGRSFEVTAGVPLPLPAYGWYQYSGVLNSSGFSSGYAIVERVSGSGPFGAYGVVNDQKTNDGSFIPALAGTQNGTRLTIPVLVETGAFESELILTNRGNASAHFTLRYVESLSPAKGPGGITSIDVAAGRQMIIPRAIDFLRSKGVGIGARGEAGYAGSVQVQVSGVGLESVFAGARTSSLSPAGGQFGLFYQGIDSSQEASDTAFVLGLKADVNNRSNVAVVNTGEDGSGPLTLELQVLDGSEGGKAVGQLLSVDLNPGQWAQPYGFFASGGVPNGYVRITRTAGTAPWIAYGVINDGGNPGERTGDGAYVPMVK